MKTIPLALAVLLLSTASSSVAGVAINEAALVPANEELFKQLTTSNRGDRLGAAIELDKQRVQIVNRLMNILKGTNEPAAKIQTIIVLGEYRAPEAVPVLVEHLDWDGLARAGFFNLLVPKEVLEERSEPVSIALEKIGIPAIPALFDKIMETDDSKIAKKCISICQRIEGMEITQFRLQGLLTKATDEKKKARLKSALEILTNLAPQK